jgi:N-acetylglutamate synthase-like GNAT family acetyltransferase
MIRLFKESDITQCKALIETEWNHLSNEIEHDISLYNREYRFFEPFILVDEIDGVIVAFSIMLRSLMTNDFYELELIIVDPKFRNKKIATNLMNECLQICKELGKGLLFVSDKPEFYRKIGFKHIHHYGENRYIIFSEVFDVSDEI